MSILRIGNSRDDQTRRGEAIFVKNRCQRQGRGEESHRGSSQYLPRIKLRVQQRRCSASDGNARGDGRVDFRQDLGGRSQGCVPLYEA